MPKQPTGIIHGQTAEYDALAERIAAIVKAKTAAWNTGLTANMTLADLRKWFKRNISEVRPAVRSAFAESGLAAKYSELVAGAMIEAMIIGYGKALPATAVMEPTALLTKKFGAKVPLSKRIWTSGKDAESAVMSILSDNLKAKSNWVATSLRIQDAELSSGNISAKIEELVSAAKRTGAPAASLAEYKRSLRSAQQYVQGLAADGAPTGYLRKAYQDVIDATISKSAGVVERRVAQAVQEKVRYEAERLVRTETARAYGVSVYNAALSDEDVVGVRSIISSRHPAEDICDFYADTDLYGLGAGVFPKNEAPPYPYHPNCLCSLQPVYKGEASEAMNDKEAEQWIDKLDEDTRKSLLGKEGAEAFAENKASWKEYLRGWNGLENKRITAI